MSEKTHLYSRSRPKTFLDHPRSLQQSQYGRHVNFDPQKLTTHPVGANVKLGDSYISDSDSIRIFRKENYVRPSTGGKEELEEYVSSNWGEGTWLTEITNNSRSLSLENYKLTRVPREICGMDLVSLNLSNNSITKLPRAIGNLTRLTGLDVSFNELSTIPIEIGQNTLRATTQFAVGGLLTMTVLRLNNNKITSLPNSISRLVNLTVIDLDHNDVEELPQGIGKWKSLDSFTPLQNSLIELPAR